MVENFGSYLKHERELRGVSLEEISGVTNIPLRFLKALEENSFDELPGEVFIKGYIRSYANIIGSDFEEMLNIYKEFVEFKNSENISSPAPSLETQSKTFLKLGFVIFLVVALVFGVRFLIKMGDDPGTKKTVNIQKADSNQPESPELSGSISDQLAEGLIKKKALPSQESAERISQTSISEELIKEKTVNIQKADSNQPESPELSGSISDQLADSFAKKKALLSQEPHELNLQTSNALTADLGAQKLDEIEKSLRLSIRAMENSWFNMTIDDFREEDFILPAGTAKTFWGNTSFRLTVGNKTGVELLLNGKTLTLPEGKDRVVKDFIITSKLVE
jgi:cytoskeleton protein RodZ